MLEVVQLADGIVSIESKSSVLHLVLYELVASMDKYDQFVYQIIKDTKYSDVVNYYKKKGLCIYKLNHIYRDNLFIMFPF